MLLVGFGLSRDVRWFQWRNDRDTAVPAEENGDLQTLICVLVARPRRCLTLSNPVPWQNWMSAYFGYTLRMKTLFRGWPVMAHEMHTRRRRSDKILPSVLWCCWLGVGKDIWPVNITAVWVSVWRHLVLPAGWLGWIWVVATKMFVYINFITGTCLITL